MSVPVTLDLDVDRVGPGAAQRRAVRVIGSDQSAAQLRHAIPHPHVHYVQAYAEAMPLGANSVDLITVAQALHWFDFERFYAEAARILRPGGKALVLEFSRMRSDRLRPLYDWYSFNVLPHLGARVAGDAESYRYLAESIRQHPPQEELRQMLELAGFERCTVNNMAGGIVALHMGCKF